MSTLMDSDASYSAPPQLNPHRRDHRQLELKEKSMRRKNFLSSTWGAFKSGHELNVILVLLCTFLLLVRCEPCMLNGNAIEKAEHVGCGSFGDDRIEGAVVDHMDSGLDSGSAMGSENSGYVCTNAHSFCFLSTLTGYLREEDKVREVEPSNYQSGCPLSLELNQCSSLASNKSWLPDDGSFEFMNGRTVFCSLNSRKGIHGISSLIDQKNSSSSASCGESMDGSKFRLNKQLEFTESIPSGVGASPHVEVSHSSLDWGRKYLYSPSVVFLTVANTCNDSVLHVYEPFSTNMQFYPCNFSEVLLGPGEVASFCFVFLPRWLGLSSAHLILQTSSGGFVIQAKGYGVESPYAISRLTSINIPSSGELRKNLSIFNPFNETIVVKEVSALLSISSGNISLQSEATCSLGNFKSSDNLSLLNAKDWLTVQNGQAAGFPLLSLRPHENWEVAPNERGAIVELDFSFGSEGRVFGAFCMHMLRPSQNESEAIVIPLEAARSGGRAHDNVFDLISISLEALPCYACKTPVVAISLFNRAHYMLNVVKISEAGSRIFQIKYSEGLLLFPGSSTQVALVGCPQPPYELCDSELENCNLIILTNDSSTQIEVPGQDIIYICSRHQKDSSIGYHNAFVGADDHNQGSRSFEAGMQGYKELKLPETAEGDKFVLDNWKSHITASGISVISDQEMIFPVVEVGDHFSQWISVKNPSDQPVVVQLILNSAEILDKCKTPAGSIASPAAGSFTPNGIGTTRYGFSLAKTAVTEAYLHPYSDQAFLGPIVFHPSNRCTWSSSALIRNNLSGVEWFSLRGVGGSLSLETIANMEFHLNLPLPLNTTSSHMLFQMEETYQACCNPLTKELSLKNTGDLPLHVKDIKVSGKECSSDGFLVHPCAGFTLDPGESTKLKVSYQTDLSGTSVHRDLELALVGGNFVIPMKATLPVYAFNLCKKSVFLVRLKKFFVAVFFIASAVSVVLYYVQHQGTKFGSRDDGVLKAERSVEKSSRVRRSDKNIKFSAAIDVDHLGLVGESKSLKWESLERNYDDAAENRAVVQNMKPTRHGIVEESEPDKLLVNIGKEKGRRRRKRKGVAGGIAGRFEVSSSQSGNSTPSSPLSPVTSVMPDRFWSPSSGPEPVQVKNPFTQLSGRDSQKPRAIASEPKLSAQCSKNNGFSGNEERSQRKCTTKPAATSHFTSNPVSNLPWFTPAPIPKPAIDPHFQAPSSVLAPHFRAPGTKHYEQSNSKAEADRYEYDIWGDHFPGLRLVESSKGARRSPSSLAMETSQSSFFVRGPQTLMKKSPLQSVSCFLPDG